MRIKNYSYIIIMIYTNKYKLNIYYGLCRASQLILDGGIFNTLLIYLYNLP
jgi:hypothetical protein